jgi:ABC-type multidrug transport system fused ATPase/permease subunit
VTFYFNPDKPLAERPPLTGVYRRIGRLLWEFRGGVGRGVFLSGLSTLLFVLLPFPIKWLIDGVLIHRSLHIAWLGTLSTATSHDKLRAGALLALVYVVVATAQALVNAASFYVIARTALLMIHTLRSRLVGHLRTLSLRYFANTSVGELIFRAINDARSIQEVMIFGLTNWATLALRMALMTVFMAILDPVLTLVALTVVPALAVTIRWLSGRIQSSAQVSRQHLANLTAHIEQTMGAIRAVQVFGEEGDQRRRFNDISLAFVRAQLRFRLSEQTLNAVTVTITALATGGVIYGATLRVIHGDVTVGALFVFLTYMQAIYQSMNQIMFVFGPFQDAVVGVGRTFQVLDTPADITERQGALDIPGFSAAIRLEEVRLDHEDGRVALAGVGLVIRRGEKVALVGQTGAGKTSVLHLLPRLHDVTGGRVTIDGHDVRDLSLVSLRRLVSMVPQEPLLFSTSIRDNILYGRLGATSEEVEAAARAARADAFICDLPRGYDTEVGDRGVKLSVGQQQRISIARAFLKDAPILLLDEPTSALDAATEADFLDSLERLMAGRTVVIVAHRLSTIRSVDRIYVLDHGRVVEEGTPAGLLERDGAYRRLYQHQADSTVTPLT